MLAPTCRCSIYPLSEIWGPPQVKVVADQGSGELLGVHMVGHGVSELLGEAMLGVRLETSLDEIERTVHPHPTLSEAFKEAALKALGRPIHLPKRLTAGSTGAA